MDSMVVTSQLQMDSDKGANARQVPSLDTDVKFNL